MCRLATRPRLCHQAFSAVIVLALVVPLLTPPGTARAEEPPTVTQEDGAAQPVAQPQDGARAKAHRILDKALDKANAAKDAGSALLQAGRNAWKERKERRSQGGESGDGAAKQAQPEASSPATNGPPLRM